MIDIKYIHENVEIYIISLKIHYFHKNGYVYKLNLCNQSDNITYNKSILIQYGTEFFLLKRFAERYLIIQSYKLNYQLEERICRLFIVPCNINIFIMILIINFYNCAKKGNKKS